MFVISHRFYWSGSQKWLGQLFWLMVFHKIKTGQLELPLSEGLTVTEGSAYSPPGELVWAVGEGPPISTEIFECSHNMALASCRVSKPRGQDRSCSICMTQDQKSHTISSTICQWSQWPALIQSWGRPVPGANTRRQESMGSYLKADHLPSNNRER